MVVNPSCEQLLFEGDETGAWRDATLDEFASVGLVPASGNAPPSIEYIRAWLDGEHLVVTVTGGPTISPAPLLIPKPWSAAYIWPISREPPGVRLLWARSGIPRGEGPGPVCTPDRRMQPPGQADPSAYASAKRRAERSRLLDPAAYVLMAKVVRPGDPSSQLVYAKFSNSKLDTGWPTLDSR
jgi:hypothetical protein